MISLLKIIVWEEYKFALELSTFKKSIQASDYAFQIKYKFMVYINKNIKMINDKIKEPYPPPPNSQIPIQDHSTREVRWEGFV